MTELTLILSAVAALLSLAAVVLLARIASKLSGGDTAEQERLLRESWNANLPPLKAALTDELRATRTELTSTVHASMKTFADSLSTSQLQAAERQDVRLRELIASLEKNQLQLKERIAETNRMLAEAQEKQFAMQDKRMEGIESQFTAFTAQNKASMDEIRTTVQSRLESLQKDNSEQLEKMRATVDEKLQKTLDERISQSFQLVNERLQEVYTGLGEMKTLANGVGDLKKVLSNVKTRGIVGEYQLGAIIREVLSPEQYEENVVTKKGSTLRVEFAIKMPGEDGSSVYLPVDAKFPGDVYAQLTDAYDTGDPAAIAAAQKQLSTRIKECARDIHDKYIDPPNTTDFGIMFLPFEGLYAEVVRLGLVEVLQRQYRVNIAGPTTFAALLNSLQMGFRTLAIQKRSSEVWNVLGAVKTEFASFEEVLTAAQKRIEQTGAELDKLVGVRTRQINRKLKSVTLLPADESARLLDDGGEGDGV